MFSFFAKLKMQPRMYLQMMFTQKVSPSVVSYNSCITAVAGINAWPLAMAMLKSMSEVPSRGRAGNGLSG